MKFLKFPQTVKFYKVVTRKESVLAISFMSYFMTDEKDHERVLGLKHKFDHWAYLNGGIFFDLNEVDTLREKIIKMAKKDQRIYGRMAKRCEQDGEKIMKFSEKIRKQNLQNKKYGELITIFKKYFSSIGGFAPFFVMPLAVEREYNEKIKRMIEEKIGGNKKKVDDYLSILIFPEKHNTDYYEQISFLKILAEYKKSKKIDTTIKRKIANHLEKFSRMGQRYGFGEIWKEQDIIERLRASIGVNPAQEIKRMEKYWKVNQTKTAKILREINAPDWFKKDVQMIKEYVFLRTYRTEVVNLSFANLNGLFYEIAARNKMSFDEINYSTYWEIVEKKFPSHKILAERKKSFGAMRNEKEFIVFIGGDIERAKKYLNLNEKEKTVSEFSGQIANTGKARGIARVLIDNSNLGKVKKGEILVAPMTTPDFIPAMEKAAAFVTDEGGLLCHAAIVGREMNKPCIIGTKIATRVLKDGDLVEVDADKGVVKILKK